MPPSCSYVPLGTYSEDTIGGMLQQASVWPWVAGMVAMVVVWYWWLMEGDGRGSIDEYVLICLDMAVEKFLSDVKGEKG